MIDGNTGTDPTRSNRLLDRYRLPILPGRIDYSTGIDYLTESDRLPELKPRIDYRRVVEPKRSTTGVEAEEGSRSRSRSGSRSRSPGGSDTRWCQCKGQSHVDIVNYNHIRKEASRRPLLFEVEEGSTWRRVPRNLEEEDRGLTRRVPRIDYRGSEDRLSTTTSVEARID